MPQCASSMGSWIQVILYASGSSKPLKKVKTIKKYQNFVKLRLQRFPLLNFFLRWEKIFGSVLPNNFSENYVGSRIQIWVHDSSRIWISHIYGSD